MRERERQTVSEWPTLEDLMERRSRGWQIAAIEWERETSEAETAIGQSANAEEIPYGLRVSEDRHHLEDDPRERQALMMLLNSIVDDRPLSHAADGLNRAGYTTRAGRPWTPAEVFRLLPRLIEAGPTIFASADWIEQRGRQSKRA